MQETLGKYLVTIDPMNAANADLAAYSAEIVTGVHRDETMR